MQYLLMLTFPEGAGPQEGTPEYDREMESWGKVMGDLRASKAVIGASGLEIGSATTVRAPGGDVTVTDGPYAETKEVLNGFYLLECADLDEAIATAARIPGAWHGAVEVRPVIEFK